MMAPIDLFTNHFVVVGEKKKKCCHDLNRQNNIEIVEMLSEKNNEMMGEMNQERDLSLYMNKV